MCFRAQKHDAFDHLLPIHHCQSLPLDPKWALCFSQLKDVFWYYLLLHLITVNIPCFAAYLLHIHLLSCEDIEVFPRGLHIRQFCAAQADSQ